MKTLKNETPEQREKRLAYYKRQHAKQKATLIALRGNDLRPVGREDDSPEERERVYREIAEMREKKRRQP